MLTLQTCIIKFTLCFRFVPRVFHAYLYSIQIRSGWFHKKLGGKAKSNNWIYLYCNVSLLK